MDKPIIIAQKLVKAYGLLPVLRELDLSIGRGEFVALLGANGSGKSTLLRLLTGLTRPTSGTLTIGGWSLPHEAAAVRGQVGLVSHRLLLYENLTAYENLLFFGRLYNLKGAALTVRVDEGLARVGLTRRRNDLVRTFSRGMQQRLSIARALLHQPDILLFDEPHTGLDPSAAEILDTLLRKAHDEERTIIMATHQFDKALTLATRIIILGRGIIQSDLLTNEMDVGKLAETYAAATLI